MPKLEDKKTEAKREPTEVEKQSLAVQAKTKTVRDYLFSGNIQKQIALALPNSMTPERLARLVLTEVRRIPDLLDCTRSSLIGSVIECAQLGLEPGTMGQAWIIPFRVHGVMTATLIVGYRGLLHLMYQSDRVRDAMAACVFKGDDFSWDIADNQISHKPCGENDPDKITHAYSIIRTVNGGRVLDVMFRAEVDAVRKQSRAGQSGPWVTHYSEMCKKTVTRRNSKYAPASTRLQRAISIDEQADLGLDQGLGESFAEVIEDEPTTVRTDEPLKTTTTPPPTETKKEEPPTGTTVGTGFEVTTEGKKEPPAGDVGFEKEAEKGRSILGLTDQEFQALKDANRGDMKAVNEELSRRVALLDAKNR